MSPLIRILVAAIVFSLPILSNLVAHSASTILVVLIVLSVFAWMTRKTMACFEPGERLVIWSFNGYFLVCLLFYLGHGLLREGASLHWNLDHEARFLAFGVILYLFQRTGLKPWTVWYGAALSGIVHGLYAVYFVYILHAGERALGRYNAIAFGDVALAAGFVGLTGLRYFHERHPALTTLPLLGLAGGVLAGFLSGTRGVLISIPLLAFIFFLQLRTFRRPWRSRLSLIAAVALLSAGLYHLPGSSMEERVRMGCTQARAYYKGEGTGDYVVRLAMWSEAWRMFLERPLTGWGKEGYKQIVRAKVDRGEAPAAIRQFSCPHNLYLNHLTAYGVLGLGIVLFVFAAPLFVFFPPAKGWGRSSDLAFAGIMHVAAFMVFALTETIFNRNININMYMIPLAALMTLIKLNQPAT